MRALAEILKLAIFCLTVMIVLQTVLSVFGL